MRIIIRHRERGILHVDGRPTAYLRPGSHRVFKPFRNVEVETFDIEMPIADLSVEQLAVVPDSDLAVIDVGELQRVVVRYRGQPLEWLGPGLHQIWTAERLTRRTREGEPLETAAVALDWLEVDGVHTDPLRKDVARLAPYTDYVEVTVPNGCVGVRTVDGAFDTVLPPGRHAAWRVDHEVAIQVVDTREQVLDVHGQEVMTKDRVSLRLNASAVWQVSDIEQHASVAQTPRDVLYLAVQMAAREAVAERTLDELLAARDALGEALRPEVQARAESVGLRVVSLGIKDLVLPGDMKVLLNRVIEARKQAEASVILRREEIAATRSMAQTAEVLEENPVLLRLKELEAYKELAESVGSVDVILGEVGGERGLRALFDATRE